jgi:CO/xanthine dehydrogenase FAD-binding subunit
MVSYHRPGTVQEALAILHQYKDSAAPFAGGTDLIVRCEKGFMPRPEAIVDLKSVEELGGITRANGEIRIGALATMSELKRNALIRDAAPALAEAASRVACPQIRNRATVGGNLCNASPAADTAIPLFLYDAVLDLVDGAGTREVPVAAFFKGPGATVLKPGELLAAIRFKVPEGVYAAWDKFGTRPSMEIAVASVGVAFKMEAGRISGARVGYGSVAPVPLRGKHAEAVLEGETLSAALIGKCEQEAREEITPITDVRASEGYRRQVIGVMLRRMLERAG